MTIPASQLVDITPRVIGGGLTGLSFVGTLLSKSTILPTNTAVPFYSASAVGEYFGIDTTEYKLAQTYFLGVNGASKKPDVLYFFRKVDAPAKAFLRGLSLPVLSTLKGITNGSFSINIDGTKCAVTGLNLASATTFTAVASAIQTKLAAIKSGVTCTYDSLTNSLTITGTKADATGEIGYAFDENDSTGCSSQLGLDGGVLSKGAIAQSLTETMEKLVASNSNFFSFAPVWDESETEALELADWCNSNGVRFLYPLLDKTTAGTIANNDNCLGHKLKDHSGVACMYNTKELVVFTMSIGACIDPNKQEDRKTWAFKSQDGLAFTCEDKNVAPILLENGYNFYGSYATASNEFKLFQNGQIGGVAKWIDTYYGQVFIKDGLQNAWLGALMNAGTIPYNEGGYSILRAAAQDTINTALTSGFIRQGIELSEAQKAQVNTEAGKNIADTLFTQGYYLQILNPTAQVRAERGTPVVNFWYMDGGSIQKIQGTSTVIL